MPGPRPQLVRSLGAAHVIDYTTDDLTREADRYDVILDNVGNRPLGRLCKALTPAGILLLNGGGSPGRVVDSSAPSPGQQWSTGSSASTFCSCLPAGLG